MWHHCNFGNDGDCLWQYALAIVMSLSSFVRTFNRQQIPKYEHNELPCLAIQTKYKRTIFKNLADL